MDRNEQTMSLREAVDLLGIHCDTRRAKTYIACPVCQSANERRNNELKMQLNFEKDKYRCAKCGDKASLTEGGPVSFWMLMRGISDPKEAAKDFYRTRGGNGNGYIKEYEKPEYKPEPQPAPIEVRDHTYSCLFRISKLRDRHRQSLKSARGLSDEDIDILGYRSCPRDGKAAAKRLLAMGCTLDGVPPFYKDEDGTWNARFYDGVMMKKLNAAGQIQNVEVCMNPGKDPSFKGAKYLPFSSADLPSGTPSRTYCHFRPGIRGLSVVILTEGILKADIISRLSGYSVLSISGVNCQKYLRGAFRALSNSEEFRGIYIAFDSDIVTNEHVRKALSRLTEDMNTAGIRYKDISGSWPDPYKGLDDYLIAQKEEEKGSAK